MLFFIERKEFSKSALVKLLKCLGIYEKNDWSLQDKICIKKLRQISWSFQKIQYNFMNSFREESEIINISVALSKDSHRN